MQAGMHLSARTMILYRPNTDEIIGVPFFIHTHHICGLDYRARRFAGECAVVLEVALVEEATCYLLGRHKFHLFWARG